MKCINCEEGYYLELETGEDYCPDCGHYHIYPVSLERSINLSEHIVVLKGLVNSLPF